MKFFAPPGTAPSPWDALQKIWVTFSQNSVTLIGRVEQYLMELGFGRTVPLLRGLYPELRQRKQKTHHLPQPRHPTKSLKLLMTCSFAGEAVAPCQELRYAASSEA